MRHINIVNICNMFNIYMCHSSKVYIEISLIVNRALMCGAYYLNDAWEVWLRYSYLS